MMDLCAGVNCYQPLCPVKVGVVVSMSVSQDSLPLQVYNAGGETDAADPEPRPSADAAPVDHPKPEVKKPSNADIFGSAKPVDTAAREREIEEKLRRQESRGSEREGAPPAAKPSAWSRGPPATTGPKGMVTGSSEVGREGVDY